MRMRVRGEREGCTSTYTKKNNRKWPFSIIPLSYIKKQYVLLYNGNNCFHHRYCTERIAGNNLSENPPAAITHMATRARASKENVAVFRPAMRLRVVMMIHRQTHRAAPVRLSSHRRTRPPTTQQTKYRRIVWSGLGATNKLQIRRGLPLLTAYQISVPWSLLWRLFKFM